MNDKMTAGNTDNPKQEHREKGNPKQEHREKGNPKQERREKGNPKQGDWETKNEKKICSWGKEQWKKTVSVLLLLSVWQVVAVIMSQEVLLPSPLSVLHALWELVRSPSFLGSAIHSTRNIIFGFFLGLFLGVTIAALSARFPFAELLLWPYMAVMKATPVASFIILCLVWLNAGNLSILISLLIVLPVIYANFLNGFRSKNTELEEMATLFGMSPLKKFLAITFQGLYPYILASFQIAIGMAWKAGIAAEVIGVPAKSIGRQMYEAKIYLEISQLFAWTIVVVVLSVLFEKAMVGLLKLLNRRMEHILWIL